MDIFVLLMQSTIVYAIPILLVALAGCFAEKSGIINLSLEGGMIFGAFFGALFVYFLEKGNAGLVNMPQLMYILAMLIAAFAGALFSLLLSVAAIKFKVDQTIAGTALNMLAPAIVLTLCLVIADQEKLVMPTMPNYIIVTSVSGFFAIFFNNIYISNFIGVALFILLSLWMYKSKVGTHMRACGEHPQAADSVGINVYRMRYLGTTISGALAGLGGYIYIATVSAGTAESSVGGMGFLALAIMIFGNWKPLTIFFGSFLFGFLKCIGPLSGSIDFLKALNIPNYVYNMIPYIIVLIVLVIARNKSGCPKAEGIPYDKGQR